VESRSEVLSTKIDVVVMIASFKWAMIASNGENAIVTLEPLSVV